MDMEQLARDNVILEYVVGSRLYGTNMPESDEDKSGIFGGGIDQYFGFSIVKEVDFSIVSKREDGRNDADAVDSKLYELRHFMKLALDNNPNIIEQLFVDPSIHCSVTSNVGLELLKHRHAFLHKGCRERFVGYAHSQKKKMVIKRDNMQAIVDCRDVLSELSVTNSPKEFVADHQDQLVGLGIATINNMHLVVGDMNLQRNITLKRAIDILNGRIDKFSGRYELVSKYGYDTKFGSHLIRLLSEGNQLLQYGDLSFPLVNADLIKDIKCGKYEIGQLLEMAEQMETRSHELAEKSKLPSGPNMREIVSLLIKLISQHWDERGVKWRN